MERFGSFGKELPSEFGILWFAPIYPEKDTIREAVAAALDLYEKVANEDWESIERGKSLASGFNDADPEAILAWNKRMAELVAMNDIQLLIDNHQPVTGVRPLPALTPIQQQWLKRHLDHAEYGEAMRLHYYIGTALSGTDGEREITAAFSSLSSAILTSMLEGLQENKDAKMNIPAIWCG